MLFRSGVTKFNVHNQVSSIEFIKGGQHDNYLRVTINETPFSSKSVIVNPKHIRSIGHYALDTEGANDTNKHVLHISEYEDSNGKHSDEIIASLPTDGLRDHTSMDWILQSKSENEHETTAMFNDLVRRDLETKTSQARKSGFMSQRRITTQEVNYHIEKKEASATLLKMEEVYGKDKLESMSPEQLYQSYRSFLEVQRDRKSTRLNSSHIPLSRMPSSA